MPKSYNPFKMWGSYVGFIIFSFINIRIGNVKESLFSSFLELGSFNLENAVVLILSFFLAIIGFLIGWGIHSLVRALRK